MAHDQRANETDAGRTWGTPGRSGRALDPIDRLSELLFGLIMVLTVTGSLSVANAGRDDVRAMLVGALGCNLAWGIIDGILYLGGVLAERGGRLRALRRVREGSDTHAARRELADALPPLVASVMSERELESLRERIVALPGTPRRARLTLEDWRGALAVFLIVFLSTLPVALPFMLMHDARPAMRVSNAVAIALLFVGGHAYGRLTQRNPFLVGVVMVVVGLLLVGLTIALGG